MSSLKDKAGWLYYQYELLTALYMLEPWEKAIFNAIILGGIFLSLITAYFYLPDYLFYSLFILTDYFPATRNILPTDVLSRVNYFQEKRLHHIY